MADEARSLAPRALAVLRARGYPGMQLVMIITHNAFIMQTKGHQVAGWEIGRSGTGGGDAAGEAVCWLLADGEFGVSTQDAIVQKRQAEDLPALPAVVSMLRALASDRPPPGPAG